MKDHSAQFPTPAFILTRWRGDGELCARALRSIRRFYPRAELVLILDGPLEPGDRLGLDLASTVIQGQPLFAAQHGGAWALRWMRAALEHTHSELIVRLDPDAVVTRALRNVPEADLFGTLEYLPRRGQHEARSYPLHRVLKTLRSSGPGRWLEHHLSAQSIGPHVLHTLLGLEAYVQGGITGCRRSALEKIVASGTLEDEDLRTLHYLHPRSGVECALDDRQVGTVVRALGLKQEMWPEVTSRWRPEFSETEISQARAVWHPVALDIPSYWTETEV